MEINKKDDDELVSMLKKLRAHFTDIEIMSILATLLGGADNVARYVLETEKGKYDALPNRCKYGMLHIYQILTLCSAVLTDTHNGKKFETGGYFPAGMDAWKSEQDFEKRFILMVKLFHKHLKDQGKI